MIKPLIVKPEPVEGTWSSIPRSLPTLPWINATLQSGNDVVAAAFKPDIKRSGNYSVSIYTPGCVQDETCPMRGRVRITPVLARSGDMGSCGEEVYELSQTNNLDTINRVYVGWVDRSAIDWTPTLKLTSLNGQSFPLAIVAQAASFELLPADSGGVCEYTRISEDPRAPPK